MALLIDGLLVAVLVLAVANLSTLLGARSAPTGERDLPFETGMRPIEPAFRPVSVTYVRYALLFVVFDVELAFLLPAVVLPELRPALAAVTLFLGLFALMLAYVWRKGALECS